MPLELHQSLDAIDAADGMAGQVSLLMYQAVKLSATVFVDMEAPPDAGYATRRAARRTFVQKNESKQIPIIWKYLDTDKAALKLLYDFDRKPNRLVVAQALLLMTYWYETSNDQRDTWHWMGLTILLAYTIDFHSDPIVMDTCTQRPKPRKRMGW